MRLRGKITLTRIAASVLCLIALSIYITFAPAKVLADASCTCGGGLSNMCASGGGQRCICLLQNQECLRCEWNDDNLCKPCLD
jgi:hypothetical protein